MNIAARIRQLCDQRSISANKLATLADIPPSTMQNILTRETPTTTVLTIEKICDALGITVADFFTEELPIGALQEKRTIEEYLRFKYSNPGK